MKKLLITLLILATISIVALLGATSASAATSGTTGDCTWTLDGTVLTISGNGAMRDYNISLAAPWGNKITKLIIKEGVTTIGDHAFSNCPSLMSVDIPDSVKNIGKYAFWNCTSLTSITIPSSVTTIGEMAFGGCNILSFVYITDLASWCNIEFADSSANPLSKGAMLFVNEQALYGAIRIPEGVKHIGAGSFWGCSSITSITIPNGVISIGESAFRDCSSLTEVIFPDSIESIGGYTFSNCSSLKSIVIPEGVTTIANNTFFSCDNLSSVTIPNSVTSIGNSAFSFCSSLKKITIPNSVISIGEGAFYHDIVLSDVNIPSAVISIGAEAFYSCRMYNITIPSSVTIIGKDAFYDCFLVENLYIESSVIAAMLVSNSACGSVATTADTIYIKSGITEVGSFVTSKKYKTEGVVVNGVTYTAYTNHACTYKWESTSTHHWAICDSCGYIGEKTSHAYDHSCDETCNDCGHTRSTTCVYDNACDRYCNVCGSDRYPITHSFKTTWEKDETGHWHECSICGISDYWTQASHGFSNSCDTTCDTCGYTRSSIVQHQYGPVKNDSDGHWHECSYCGYPSIKSPHTPGAAILDPTVTICTTCGYVIKAAPDHTHNFKTEWSSHTSKHWHDCTGCSDRKDEGDHVYTNYCDTACNTCGYIRPAAHIYKTTWEKNGTQHWHDCSVCGSSGTKSNHNYDNDSDASCNTCGHTRTVVTTTEQTETPPPPSTNETSTDQSEDPTPTSTEETQPDETTGGNQTTDPIVEPDTTPEATSGSGDKGGNGLDTTTVIIIAVATAALGVVGGIVVGKIKKK